MWSLKSPVQLGVDWCSNDFACQTLTASIYTILLELRPGSSSNFPAMMIDSITNVWIVWIVFKMTQSVSFFLIPRVYVALETRFEKVFPSPGVTNCCHVPQCLGVVTCPCSSQYLHQMGRDSSGRDWLTAQCPHVIAPPGQLAAGPCQVGNGSRFNEISRIWKEKRMD